MPFLKKSARRGSVIFSEIPPTQLAFEGRGMLGSRGSSAARIRDLIAFGSSLVPKATFGHIRKERTHIRQLDAVAWRMGSGFRDS